MSRARFPMFVVAVLALTAASVTADEYDFVGHQYTQDYQRDYDRGFFFGAEGWFANPRNLHFEPAFSVAPNGPTGGVLLDVDFDFVMSPRAFLGWQASRRIGRFTLEYWDFHEDETRYEEASGANIFLAGTHPARGDVNGNRFWAAAEVDMEHAEFEWRKDFGWGRKFSSFWTVSAQAWEMEYETEAMVWMASQVADANAPDARVNRISDRTESRGAGGKVGFGGRYQFNDRFSMGAYGAVGFSSTEQDYVYVDENPAVGTFAFLVRDETELTTMQFEGDLNFHLRVAGGFEIDWGYRYLDFQDAVAEDRFVDNAGKFIALEQQHGLAFEGPYLGFRYVTGVSKIDNDGDGVLDALDDCPDTPAGAWVDEKGCPRDLDEDGVYDGIDRCPGTQFGTRVDEWGCGVDSDGDGVPDGLDLCPNTPGCALVDGRGCPKDTDGDGVANGCDACPGTGASATVDARGCAVEVDSDGDTVPDGVDRCPNTARGATVDEHGCAEVVSITVNFASDSAEIRSGDRMQLDRLAMALRSDAGDFEVQGHTDSDHTVQYNQGLSERRARSVMTYLISRGVLPGQLRAVGYSELRPIATNDRPDGKAANRRVEIVRR